jgi:cell filamentation protein
VDDVIFSGSVEPEYYPNTTTFVNLLGISVSKELRDKEAAFTAIRSFELFQDFNIIPQSFDFEHLKTIHKYLFQDLYVWAGQPRSYDMKKGDNIFTPAKELAKYEAKAFEKSIEYSKRRQKPSMSESATTLASCLGIINSYHPFPEGNGRTQRIFISALANVFQYSLNWDDVHAWEIVETSKQYHIGNHKPLRRLIERIISNPHNNG